jgi:hypothetical protein
MRGVWVRAGTRASPPRVVGDGDLEFGAMLKAGYEERVGDERYEQRVDVDVARGLRGTTRSEAWHAKPPNIQYHAVRQEAKDPARALDASTDKMVN